VPQEELSFLGTGMNCGFISGNAFSRRAKLTAAKWVWKVAI
jgi:hypothetical protein